MATLINDNIISTVADVYGVTKRDILGNSRKQPIAEARQLAMYLYWKEKYTSVAIAKMFGREHATILHNIKRIKELIEIDAVTRKMFNKIESKLWNRP